MKTKISLALTGVMLWAFTAERLYADMTEAKSTSNTSISGQRVVKPKSFAVEPRIGYATIDYSNTVGTETSQTSNTAQLGVELFVTDNLSLMGSASSTFNTIEPSDPLTAQYIDGQATINNNLAIWRGGYLLSYGGGANYATTRDKTAPFAYENIWGPMVRTSLTRTFSSLNSLSFDAQYGNIGLNENRFSARDYQARAALDYRFRLFSDTQAVIGLHGTMLEIRQDDVRSTVKTAALTAGLNI